MQRWLSVSRRIDRLNLALGRAVAWLAVLMVGMGAFNAVSRYAGRFIGWNLSSNAWIELQWYMFSVLFLLGAAATLARDGHVRVDVLYSRLGVRGRIWIDLLGIWLLLIPFCTMALLASWPAVRNSFSIGEVSPDPGGLLRYPIKALILLAFALLIVQGIAQAIQLVAKLRGVEDA